VFKAMILLTRRDDMTHDDFVRWWLDEHSALASTLPGVRAITFNVVDDGNDGVDGVAELWFDSREAFEAAYATEIGKATAADSMAHVKGRVRLLVAENAIVER